MKRGFLALAATLLLSGCLLPLYGVSAMYPRYATPDFEVVLPANAPRISQQFFLDPPDDGPAHPGLDVWAVRGAPVIAAAPGRVIQSYYEPLYGHRVVLAHGPDEAGQNVYTVYLHLLESGAPVGTEVARGAPIGKMGATGMLGLAIHLHFEVRRGPTFQRSKPEDPQLTWVGGPGRVTCFDPDLAIPRLPFRTTYPVPCRPG